MSLCSLVWWKNESPSVQNVNLRYLPRLAKRILSIPATSAPVERLFSTMGNIVTQKRGNHTTENARKLLLMKDTWPHVPIDKKEKLKQMIDTVNKERQSKSNTYRYKGYINHK